MDRRCDWTTLLLPLTALIPAVAMARWGIGALADLPYLTAPLYGCFLLALALGLSRPAAFGLAALLTAGLWAGSANLPPALARATLVPIFNVPVAGTPAAALPLVRLGAPHLVVGRGVWKGPDDLSATVRMAADSEHLRLEVAVTDEKLTTGGVPNYDGVELFLDLRDDANRGRPHFTRQCITLFLHPALDGAPRVGTLTDDQPPPALLELPLQCEQRDDGYTLTLDLPRALLDEIAGRRVTRLGLDLGVDDSDSNGRECQLMWLGRADNYVNPRRLGEFRLDDPAPLGSLRLTVF
ncbi:MAG: hypothetical protein HUU35_07245 [Armatimonadetes bacterium]|nr:hypothetical protein [Armatimonadota bacterium]